MIDSKKHLVEHLREIKTRVLFGLGAFLIFLVVGLFLTEPLYTFFITPLAQSEQAPLTLLLTEITSGFSLSLRLGFVFAFVCSLPIWLFQVWRFILPALKKKERSSFSFFFLAMPFLFFFGASFAYFVITPLAWDFLLSFYHLFTEASLPATLTPRVEEYINLMLSFLITFGLAFELPAVLLLLIRLKVLPVSLLIKARRYVIVGIFVLSALLTPPDILSQLLLAFPLIGLYELAILFGRKM